MALRARRPRALGHVRRGSRKSECDERAYTYQQDLGLHGEPEGRGTLQERRDPLLQAAHRS
jgi:hypothetical protein